MVSAHRHGLSAPVNAITIPAHRIKFKGVSGNNKWA